MAPTSVGLVELIVCVNENSEGLPSACASVATFDSAAWMLVNCVFIAVRPVCWLVRFVTCCCWVAISAVTIAFVSRPEARPVTCSGEPDPSEVS